MAGSINERMKQFFADLASDPVEERVIEYVIREVRNGRRLMEVMEDPFVRNRLDECGEIFERPGLVAVGQLDQTTILQSIEKTLHVNLFRISDGTRL